MRTSPDPHHAAAPRAYRITDLLPNGVAVLDALDDQPRSRRRIMQTADLPAGAELNTDVSLWPDGQIDRIALASEPERARDSDACATPPAPVIMLLTATILTLSETLQVSHRAAAYMCLAWLQVELGLLCD